MISTSYTYTREQLIAELRPTFESVAKDMCGDMFDGDEHAKNTITGFFNFNNKPLEELINFWCDLFSEDFFKSNPEVNDVLVVKEVLNDSIVIKEWMASRS